jgi:hypothetical protein
MTSSFLIGELSVVSFAFALKNPLIPFGSICFGLFLYDSIAFLFSVSNFS